LQARSHAIQPNQPTRVRGFFCSDPTQYLIAANFTVSVDSGIPSGNETLATLANNSVCLKLLASSEQNNVADSEHVCEHGFDVYDLPILDGRQHASPHSLEAESVTGGDQVAGEQMECQRFCSIFNHGS
jgi:hypothetical protein